MSEVFPELVIVAGPQKGERVTLRELVMVLGRSGEADVLLTEQFVSRQHARYERGPEGPTVECLSDHGLWVNGKRYKPGKRLLLASGDMLGLGHETEILFVAAGDETGEVLAAWQGRPKPVNAFGKKVAPAAPARKETSHGRSEDSRPPAKQAKPRKVETLPSADAAVVSEKKRRRRLYIMLGIYIVALTVGATVLYIATEKPTGSAQAPPMLTEQQIAEALTERPALTPNLKQMSDRLEQARTTYAQCGQDTRKLYQVVRLFDEALAYSGKSVFDNPDDEKAYTAALKTLTDSLTDRYRDAMLLEKAQNWTKAEQKFSELLAILTSYSATSDKDVLFSNVQLHHRYIKATLLRKAPSKRTPWG